MELKKLTATNCYYPCRCLCFGFEQMTYTFRRRLTTLQCTQILFIDAFTFIPLADQNVNIETLLPKPLDDPPL